MQTGTHSTRIAPATGATRSPRRLILVALVAALCRLALPAPALAGAPLTPAEVTAWVARLEGVWAGANNMTPLGAQPFAAVFEREADGSLHAHSASSPTQWLDFRFKPAPDGEWLFTEGGRLGDAGEQWHTLRLTSASGDTLTWSDVDRPEWLSCRIAPSPERLWMRVLLRGAEHARFELPRLEGLAALALRQQFATAAAASQSTRGVHFALPADLSTARSTGGDR